MDRDSLRGLAVGLLIGAVTNEPWLRWHLRAWIEAVERSDFEEAERQANRAYLSYPRLWLRRTRDE